MRFVSNVIFVILFAALIAMGWLFQKHNAEEELKITDTKHALEVLQHAVNRRMAGEDGPLNEFGYPPTIKADWFEDSIPTNPLLDRERPWLEIATGKECMQLHPSMPIADSTTKAEFWYNPRRGLVRARVPQMVSDRKTLEVYNRINSSELGRLFPTGQVEFGTLPNNSTGGGSDPRR